MHSTFEANNENVLVSIIIPLYNAERFIKETIKCLLAQTWENVELIIVNDGSTDSSLEIAKTYENENVRILSQDNKGAGSARNRGYLVAKGTRIIFFDADDFVDPHFIKSQMECLGNQNDSVCVSAWGRFDGFNKQTFNKNTNDNKCELTFEEWIRYYWRNNTHTTPPGRILIPRLIIERAGSWNESLTLNDDFEFFARVFCEAKKIIYNPHTLFYYRSNIGGLSQSKSLPAYTSHLNSLLLAIDIVELRTSFDQEIRKCCANTLQLFLFEIYPSYQKLANVAQEKINFLGPADITFPCGGYTELLRNLVGWKLTKMIKNFYSDFRKSN
jgi:glycosyltransferase involved in cell wall biosynthesis